MSQRRSTTSWIALACPSSSWLNTVSITWHVASRRTLRSRSNAAKYTSDNACTNVPRTGTCATCAPYKTCHAVSAGVNSVWATFVSNASFVRVIDSLARRCASYPSTRRARAAPNRAHRSPTRSPMASRTTCEWKPFPSPYAFTRSTQASMRANAASYAWSCSVSE